eukprot:3090847-Karenia_brevis.AAC.1
MSDASLSGIAVSHATWSMHEVERTGSILERWRYKGKERMPPRESALGSCRDPFSDPDTVLPIHDIPSEQLERFEPNPEFVE